jgi:serine/threonine protein kinase
MGTVYLASDLSLERQVAVKVIRDDLVGSADAAERFRREARVAASFAHPNVVTVHDFGVVARTRAFLVMELLQGAPSAKSYPVKSASQAHESFLFWEMLAPRWSLLITVNWCIVT